MVIYLRVRGPVFPACADYPARRTRFRDESSRREMLMIANRFLYLITLGVAVGLGPRITAQVQTDVPAAVPGAKPEPI